MYKIYQCRDCGSPIVEYKNKIYSCYCSQIFNNINFIEKTRMVFYEYGKLGRHVITITKNYTNYYVEEFTKINSYNESFYFDKKTKKIIMVSEGIKQKLEIDKFLIIYYGLLDDFDYKKVKSINYKKSFEVVEKDKIFIKII